MASEKRMKQEKAARFLRKVAAMGVIIGAVMPGRAQTLPVDAPQRDVTTSSVVRHDDALTTVAEHRDTGLSSFTLSRLQPDRVTSGSIAFDPATMMHVDDIRPGMKGYGLSVFSGLRPEKFEAEVVGVRHRMLAGTDIVLCRLTSPYLVNLGVIAGMSGSPVYMDGKLIGAVAYGFINVDEPLAGITPIEDMLKVYNSTPVEAPEVDETAADQAGGADLFASYMDLRRAPTLANVRRTAQAGGGATPATEDLALDGGDWTGAAGLAPGALLEPLAAPVILSGQSGGAALASAAFPSMKLLAADTQAIAASTAGAGSAGVVDLITTGGVPSTYSENSPGGPVTDLAGFAEEIAGGYALAVPFVEGDLNMSGVGTVTWREGNRLIAFGHPMMQAGSVKFPMAAARINALVRSRERPFKLGEPVGHVGMILQDRVPAVGGLFGKTARMIPVEVEIDDPGYDGRRKFQYRLWQNRQMSPGFLLTVLGESIGTAARTSGESAALVSYTVQLDDGTSITAENYLSDTRANLGAIIGAMADFGTLLNNPFQPVDVSRVSFKMQVMDVLREAKLEAASMDKAEYRPGEKATVEWVLRPFREEPVRLQYELTIPRDLPDGDYTVVVVDASTRNDLEAKRNPALQKPADFADLVQLLGRNFPQNRVYVALVDQDTGVSVGGKEMPRLPGSVINLIQETVDTEYFAPVRGNFVVDADVATTYQVTGKAAARLTVKRR